MNCWSGLKKKNHSFLGMRLHQGIPAYSSQGALLAGPLSLMGRRVFLLLLWGLPLFFFSFLKLSIFGWSAAQRIFIGILNMFTAEWRKTSRLMWVEDGHNSPHMKCGLLSSKTSRNRQDTASLPRNPRSWRQPVYSRCWQALTSVEWALQ